MTIGAVLLHGKWDRPTGAIAPLGAALREAGLQVSMPECSWSLKRLYDQDFPTALREIDNALQALRADGCRRLLLCGHSFGANAALACAAGGADVDAIAMIAPGHRPDWLAATGATTEALARARRAPAGRRIRLPDFNQQQRRELRFEPAVWTSFFDPAGLAVMPRSARAVRAGVPVLWFSERVAAPLAIAPDYAFDLLPAQPENSWIDLGCGHQQAPAKSASRILRWINTLREMRWKT